MKGKLVKCNHFYALQIDSDIIAVSLDKETQSHTVNYKYSLSKQNCDEIFGVIDIKKLANERSKTCEDCDVPVFKAGYYDGFQEGFEEAMELNKDNVFTLEDMMNCWNKALKFQDHKETLGEYITSLQQTEWDVEIVEECLDPTCDGVNRKGECITTGKPKLDSDGCLILKRI